MLRIFILISTLMFSGALIAHGESTEVHPYGDVPVQTEETPLLPEDFLSITQERFPQILESLQRERAAAGSATAANGAFDLVFSADGFARVTGFWSGDVINTEVRQNLRPLGATVYGGYRVSDGTFPIYEDINFTNTGGEFKVGALFSLLRDRSIDARRFGVVDTALARQQASLEVMLARVGTQQRALSAYWRWVAAGRELRVYRDLLAIAKAREAGLEEQVRQGAIAEIAVVENRQNITRRQILAAEAERNFQIAANALSFFLRDETGRPRVPNAVQLPGEAVFTPLTPGHYIQTVIIDEVLAGRPELRSLRVAVERATNAVSLGKNQLKPKLDVNIEVSRDVGAVAEGGISRDSTDTVIGFKFSVPLQRREARGRLERAEAQLEAAKLREQQTEEQIEIEVRNILIQLTTSLDLATLARADVDQSETMVAAERRRFELGASDFFLVNLREETAADARIRYIRADLNGRLAEARYNAATLNLDALGLGDLR